MSKVYPVDPAFAAKARVRKDDYERLYAESVNDPEAFWGTDCRAIDLDRETDPHSRCFVRSERFAYSLV